MSTEAKLYTVSAISEKGATPVTTLGGIGSAEDIADMQTLIQDAAIEASEFAGVGCQITDEKGDTVLFNDPAAASASSKKTYGLGPKARSNFDEAFGADHPGRMGYNFRNKKLLPQ